MIENIKFKDKPVRRFYQGDWEMTILIEFEKPFHFNVLGEENRIDGIWIYVRQDYYNGVEVDFYNYVDNRKGENNFGKLKVNKVFMPLIYDHLVKQKDEKIQEFVNTEWFKRLLLQGGGYDE